jgi:dTDP-4-amino-4,6-dideoxygalactose transaminase
MTDPVHFNVATLTGRELDYIREALQRPHLSGNGPFTKRCQAWLEQSLGGGKALLTHSCTAALEMAALLLDLNPGDEVIMPSFTFTSTANAFVLRGAVPVFVDIRADTLNIDETLIEAAITPLTKAICVVHYAGVGADMAAIMAIAERHGLPVVEDAAQALQARQGGRPLGAWGHLSAFSFHETKNIIAGEGGALIVNDPGLQARAEHIWEKGTNRAAFNRGEVNRYTWVDVGSSFLPSELIAAFLFAQLEQARAITDARLARWQVYNAAFERAEQKAVVRRPVIPADCDHNGHIFYLLVPATKRDQLLKTVTANGVHAIIHYVPLHSAPAGRKFGRPSGELPVTDDTAARLIRLPLHTSLSPEAQSRVINTITAAI